MSRLKKKLLLYFLLISIVSISVSAEIILELGSPAFRKTFNKNLERELVKVMPQEQAASFISTKLDSHALFENIRTLQFRMILLLLVVSASIVGAFLLFTKDIIRPLDGMVNATKKIADGDLRVSVPVISEDEIGQIGNLINGMNTNLQDLILQIKSEVNRLQNRIGGMRDNITSVDGDIMENAMTQKKLYMKDLKEILQAREDMRKTLSEMMTDLSALQAFINLYKVFEITQMNEISKDQQ